MAIAAGELHSVALRNDGTVIAWGDNSYGQTNVPPALSSVKMIAAGGDHTLAAIFSPLVQYPVDVTKDLLLIYNTNSVDSGFVKDYYLAHRPMVGGANVLGIGCTNTETIDTTAFGSDILASVRAWLNANPTKHPQYMVLFLDIPSQVGVTNNGQYAAILSSVGYGISTNIPGIQPFVMTINMDGTNDCRAYIDKLEFMGTNYSPGKLIIGTSASGYGNTNYYFDDTREIFAPGTPFAANDARNGVHSVNPASSVTYSNIVDTGTNLLGHITNGTDVAGYLSWGAHSYLKDCGSHRTPSAAQTIRTRQLARSAMCLSLAVAGMIPPLTSDYGKKADISPGVLGLLGGPSSSKRSATRLW